MAELVEYTLVVMASTLFVAGSVLVYGGFSSFESGVSLHATFAAVSSLASKAMEDGTAKGVVTLPGATIACHGGLLSVKVGSSSQNEALPLSCDFEETFSGGAATLVFTDESSRLSLAVL